MNKYVIVLIVLSLVIVGCSSQQAPVIHAPVVDTPVNEQPNNNPAPVNFPAPNDTAAPIVMDNKTIKLNSSGPSPEIVYTPVPSFVGVPTVSNGKISVSWKVTGSNPDMLLTSRIYFDKISHPGTLGKEDYPDYSGYKDWTESFTSDSEKYVPRTFSTTIDVPANASTVYLRAQVTAVGYNYWTDEIAVNVN